MKVLIINTVSTGFNGITNAIFTMLDALRGQDILIDYITNEGAEQKFIDNFSSNWGNLYILSRNHVVTYFLYLIKKNKYDIVHVHGNSHTLSLEMLAAMLAGCKVRIAHGHNSMCYHKILHKLLSPFFYLSCNYGFACSNDTGKFLFGNHIKYHVLYNGIELNKFRFDLIKRLEIRKKNGFEDSIVIGNIAAMRPEKNRSFLIVVFSELLRMNQSYRLLLVGDGKDRPFLEEKVKKLNLSEYVFFTGFVDVSEYLSAMDLIVMPSLFEGLPISLIEEQTNGLPCVVSTCITREVDVTNKVHFISLNKTKSEWATYISNLQIDRNSVSANKSYELVKQNGFDITDEANWLINFYSAAIELDSK